MEQSIQHLMNKTTNDILWTTDLIERLQSDLAAEAPRVQVIKTEVLNNLYMVNKEEGFKFNLSFSDEDIVITENILDISEFMNISKLNLNGQEESFRGRIVVPSVVIRVYFDGITETLWRSDQKNARDIKSMFPQCRYVLCLGYPGIAGLRAKQSKDTAIDFTVCFRGEKPDSAAGYRRGDWEPAEGSDLVSPYRSLFRFTLASLRSQDLKIL
jgi:hypothetical protein